MTDAEKQLLVSEVNLLRGLKHEHIVRYYDRVVDRAGTTIYIIMEFCEGGDLGSLITKCKKDRKFLEEDFIWKILKQVTLALQECHKRVQGKAILHRDLKPANVFLDLTHNVKLGDFGLARVLNHETSFAKTFVGTPYYMSPEQMNHASYNEKSDIWSLGCLLYESCSLSPPFTAPDQKILATKIREGRFKRLPSQYSNVLNDIISSMLRVNPILRPSIEELLHHPKIQAPSVPKEEGKRVSPVPRSDDKDKREDLHRREEQLRLGEFQLNERQQELDAKEKRLELRENMAREKLSRAESLLKEYQQLKTNDRVMELRKQTDFQDEIHPVALCADQKGKRKVRFVAQGKENGHHPLRERNLNGGELKRQDSLQQRLYHAKIRGAALKQIEQSAKYKSKQLLSMR
ncbi:putative serine/threonine-protein kinase Nek2 [Apostichopus japonicus]|uniref:non-specific serine/threonine protein kinase n=1 Tax=Stichopus japonicus TaxID=307972 RepID=A0A2G8KWZ5_STIJA|nr:putative serine/threonine-protein kinase Nek2 [Apostichopus japonicus]